MTTTSTGACYLSSTIDEMMHIYASGIDELPELDGLSVEEAEERIAPIVISDLLKTDKVESGIFHGTAGFEMRHRDHDAGMATCIKFYFVDYAAEILTPEEGLALAENRKKSPDKKLREKGRFLKRAIWECCKSYDDIQGLIISDHDLYGEGILFLTPTVRVVDRKTGERFFPSPQV